MNITINSINIQYDEMKQVKNATVYFDATSDETGVTLNGYKALTGEEYSTHQTPDMLETIVLKSIQQDQSVAPVSE